MAKRKQNFLAARKKNEIIAFLWVAAAIFLFLCLTSYSPDDIGYEASSPNSPLLNYVGITGAYLSWGLLFVFGRGSFFFILLFLFWALAAWADRKSHSAWIKIFSGTIFFISSCASLSLLAGPETSSQFQNGGLVGFFLAATLKDLFGRAALYISGTLFVLSVLLATDFLVLPIIFALIRKFKDHAVDSLDTLIKENANEQKTSQSLSIRFDSSQKNRIHTAESEFKSVRPKNRLHDTLQEAPSTKPVIRSLIPKQSKTEEPNLAASSQTVTTRMGNYQLPPLSLLNDPPKSSGAEGRHEIEQQSHILEQTLADFGIDAKVVEVEQGPTITRYELQPASGVKIQKIVGLSDNIALAMQATTVRIVAPIPGKSRVGIEIPNRVAVGVTLKELLHTPYFQAKDSKLMIALGKDAAGAPIYADLDSMPHLLIAGSTGSGKTVCVNAIITTLLLSASPDEVKFILIDPKRVELAQFNNLPHLLTPVLTEMDKAPAVLNWLVHEMEGRYKKLSENMTRNLAAFNAKMKSAGKEDHMPYIVVVIDELADLMITAGKEVEHTITRLSQLARAVGIHLVLATQRPSVNVITGVIKANFPARVAFQVASKVDSRTILDVNGADALLGKGDLLFQDPVKPKPIRAQGPFLSDDEIHRVTDFIRKQRETEFNESVTREQTKRAEGRKDFRDDSKYAEACRVIISSGQASVSMLQRRLGLGYTRAARLVDMMEEDGIVGPHRGAKPRDIFMDMEQLLAHQNGTESEESDDDKETAP